MDDLQEQLLMPEGVRGLSSVLSKPLSFGIAKKFTSISDTVINRVAIYLQLIWSVRAEKDGNKDFSDGITLIRDVFENVKFKFSGKIKQEDVFWMRDCAGSLREVILDLRPDDYQKAFKNIDIEKESTERLRILESIKTFLSEVAHFRIKTAETKILDILTKEELAKLSSSLGDDFKAKFELVCIKMVYILHSIFEDYCYKRDE